MHAELIGKYLDWWRRSYDCYVRKSDNNSVYTHESVFFRLIFVPFILKTAVRSKVLDNLVRRCIIRIFFLSYLCLNKKVEEIECRQAYWFHSLSLFYHYTYLILILGPYHWTILANFLCYATNFRFIEHIHSRMSCVDSTISRAVSYNAQYDNYRGISMTKS